MRNRKAAVVCAVLGCLVFTVAAAFAGEAQKPEGMSEQDYEKMMEKMMAMGQPGPYHDHLKVFEGSWKLTVKHWQGAGEPEISEATARYEWILGGRFLRETVKGTFRQEPFEGNGVLGYDNAKNQYCTVWCDNMGTGFYTSNGTCDESGKVFTFHSTHTNPVTGQDQKGKAVAKVINDDNIVYTMYMIDDAGNEHKSMEITYQRM